MTGLRLPLRLARREVRRRPGRTSLVALLVALPVAGMVLAVTLIRTDGVTPAEAWERHHGQADAVGVSLPAAPGLAPGARSVRVHDLSYFPVRTEAGRRSDLQLSDHPLLDPIMVGFAEVVAGRAPTKDHDIALSPTAARQLGVVVGDELVLDRPAARFDVVGLVEEVDCISCRTAIVTPGIAERVGGGITPQNLPFSTFDLVDLPSMSKAQLVALETSAQLRVRDLEIERFPQRIDQHREEVRWSLVLGGVVLTVVGIVISAAFAVGARRQLVTLGQLSASGASPNTVRTTLVLQGTLTGLFGAAGGLAIAGLALVAGHNWFERLLNQRFGDYELPLDDLPTAVVIGVVAATIAALIPARTAAGIPTLSALAGRRPLSPVPRRLIGWGLVAIAGGLALLALAVIGSRDDSGGDRWTYVAIVGGVAELLGACAVSPALVARLEPLASHLRGGWRMAARGLARNRTRTGAVVSAVGAAGALAIAASALIQGAEAREPKDLDGARDVVVAARSSEHTTPIPAEQGGGSNDATERALPSEEDQADLARILPGVTASVVRAANEGDIGAAFWDVPVRFGPDGSYSGYGYVGFVVADDAVLDAVGADGADRAALEADGVVHLVAVGGGQPFTATLTSDVALEEPLSVSGTSVEVDDSLGGLSNLLITEERALELGLAIHDTALLYQSPADLTKDQSEALSDLLYDEAEVAGTPESTATLSVSWSGPDSGPTPFQLELLLAGVALAFALFVVSASLALAAAESKDERDILTIAGAPPRILARAAGARAWLLSGLGGLVAIPIGFLPVVVFTHSQSRDDIRRFPLVFPSRTALLLLLVVPTVVALVARAASATAQRLRPVRVSTATFE